MSVSEQDRDAVIAGLRERLTPRTEILLAVLHGSFPAGEPYRDIDVAVWIDPGRVPVDERARYAIDVAVELERVASAPVDVQVLNDASLAFRYHALAGIPLVVRDAESLAELKARTWDEYFDFLPASRQYLREALSG
jgi:hypothetical protein